MSPVDFTIYAGTYERLLVGIDGNLQEDASVKLSQSIGFSAHISSVKCLAIGGNHLATGSTDEVIKLFNIRTRKELGAIHSHQGTISSLHFHQASHLISASSDGSLIIFRTKDYEQLKTMDEHKGQVEDFAIHPSGNLALSISTDMTMKMWDLQKGKCALTTRLRGDDPMRKTYKKIIPEKIKFNASGEKCAILYADRVDIHDCADPGIVKSTKDLDGFEKSRLICFDLYTAEDKEFMLVGHENGKMSCLRIDGEDLELIASFETHKNRVKTLQAFTVKNRVFVASGSSDGQVTVRDMDSDASWSFPTGARLVCMAVYVPPAAAPKKRAAESDINIDSKRQKS